MRSELVKDKPDKLTIEHFIIRKAYNTMPFMVVQDKINFIGKRCFIGLTQDVEPACERISRSDSTELAEVLLRGKRAK